MRLYHTTDAADSILTHGFRDGGEGEGSYGFSGLTVQGVFLALAPADVNDGATGEQVLAVELPDGIDLDAYSIVEEGQPAWEWCVPADVINRHGSVRLLTEDEADAAINERWNEGQ